MNAAGEDMGTRNCIHVNEDNTNWSEANDTNGWYALTTSWYFRNTISVTGTVNLILCDSPSGSFTLTAEKGIVLNPDSHLIVWAQSGGTGKITAYGGEEYHPGIGNYAPYNSGNLTINGGNFNVSGGNNAPGLGSCGSSSGDITINGGGVNATGGHKADQEANAPGIGASDLSVSDTEVFTGTMNNIYFLRRQHDRESHWQLSSYRRQHEFYGQHPPRRRYDDTEWRTG